MTKFSLDERLQKVLREREAKGLLRKIISSEESYSLVDFSSNDYLGLARSPHLLQSYMATLQEFYETEMCQMQSNRSGCTLPPHLWLGSSGSRLLSGNTSVAEFLEEKLCEFHNSPAALIFNSGFDANSGFFGCISEKEDLILYDELIHASVHEGMKVSRGKRTKFLHNDVASLETEILKYRAKNTPGKMLVVVESVYSMDGDFAPLEALVEVCNKYDAMLVVDEAHATGLFGPRGAGRVQELGLEGQVYARLHTFGKGIGCYGAVLLCTPTVRSYLVNYARPLIYSTSLPPLTLLTVLCAYEIIDQSDDRRDTVHRLIARFRRNLADLPSEHLLPSATAIQGIVIPGNDQIIRLAKSLREAGFDVKPIRSPTVPAGKERVRICLHYHNTEFEVDQLCDHIRRFFANVYNQEPILSENPLTSKL